MFTSIGGSGYRKCLLWANLVGGGNLFLDLFSLVSLSLLSPLSRASRLTLCRRIGFQSVPSAFRRLSVSRPTVAALPPDASTGYTEQRHWTRGALVLGRDKDRDLDGRGTGTRTGSWPWTGDLTCS